MSRACRSDARFFAEYWGRQMLARDEGAALGGAASTWGKGAGKLAGGELYGYDGMVDSGQYRPSDDPHPGAFVVIQVSRCLCSLGVLHGALAWHLWVCGKPHSSFRNPALIADNPLARCFEIEDEILFALQSEIKSRDPGTISARSIALVKRRRREWAAREAARLADSGLEIAA